MMHGNVGYIGDLRIDVLGPLSDGCLLAATQKSINNTSLVLRVSTDVNSFLLMGDAEKQYEKVLVDKYGTLLSAKVLKAGHHCSDTSSTQGFISAVSPELVICSTGAGNSYGHPSKSVLERFEASGIPYWVTYEHGTLEFEL